MSQGAATLDYNDHPLLRALATYDPGQSSFTYYFAAAGEEVNDGGYSGGSELTSAWTASERAITAGVFARYSEVADVSFAQTTNKAAADFNMQMVEDVPGGWAGYAGGNVFVVGSADIGLITHELGHSLGLDHPFSGDHTLPGVRQNESDDPGDFGFNALYYTILGYREGHYEEAADIALPTPDSLGVLDIAALQAVYGANETHNALSTTYGLTDKIIAIWDAGGTDTIDFSDSRTDGSIDLRAATLKVETGGLGYASIIDMGGSDDQGAYTIAYGVTIENGYGGAGDDTLQGNSANNRLTGGLGRDTIYGGAGNDVLEGSAPDGAITSIDMTRLNSGSLSNSRLEARDYAMPGSTTIDMVLRFDDGVSHEQRILSYAPDNQNALGLELQLWGEDFPQLFAIQVTPGSGGRVNYSTLSTGISRDELMDGDFHRITVSRDAGTGELRFYLDGVFQGSDTDRPGTSLPTGGDLVFGQSQGVWGNANSADHAFEGQMGPIAVYNRVLSDTDVASRSIDDLADPGSAGLVSYWTPQTGGSFADVTSGQALQATRTGAVETIALQSEDDTLHGGTGNDVIRGGAGTDTLYGDAGNDVLNGGSGLDVMRGGDGNDFYVVDRGGDSVQETDSLAAGGGTDTIRSFVNYTLPEFVERGVLGFVAGRKDSNITGNSEANFLRGNAGDNVLAGRAGADVIRGLAGDDVLFGQRGRDTLYAGAGEDRITGGIGADLIFGGADADTFVYTRLADSRVGGGQRDVIRDFGNGQDRIDISAIDADLTRGGNQAFSFIDGQTFSGTAGELRINRLEDINAVIIAGDNTGDGGANFQIFLANTSDIGASDFVF